MDISDSFIITTAFTLFGFLAALLGYIIYKFVQLFILIFLKGNSELLPLSQKEAEERKNG